MNKFKIIFEEINMDISKIPYDTSICDLSDVGNIIGGVIAKHFDDSGCFDKETFLAGLNHGISITDGTHD